MYKRQRYGDAPAPPPPPIRYDEDSTCYYASTKLNFAIHIRLGDRRAFQDGNLEYFQLLELFMDTVSQEVVRKGLEPPQFHVFSETMIPCPSADSGLFEEFPTWPVKLDKVRKCNHAHVRQITICQADHDLSDLSSPNQWVWTCPRHACPTHNKSRGIVYRSRKSYRRSEYHEHKTHGKCIMS